MEELSKTIYVFDLTPLGDGRGKVEIVIPYSVMLDTVVAQLGCPTAPVPKSSSYSSWRFSTTSRPSVRERSMCFQAMERMSAMGRPIVDVLLAAIEVTTNIHLQYALSCAYYDIKFRGESVADAFSKHPTIFSATEVGQIQAGESTGRLDNTFHIIANHLESIRKVVVQAKIQSLYPIVIGAMLYLIVSALLLFLVPMLAETFANFNVRLPLPTVVILEASAVVVKHSWVLAAVPLLCVLGWNFRVYLAPFVLSVTSRLPIVRGYYLRSQLAQSVAALATLLRGGVIMQKAVEMLEESTADRRLRKAYHQTCDSLRNGVPAKSAFSPVMRYFGEYARDFRIAISVGEESGDMATSLFRASEHYMDDFIRISEGASKIIEPVGILLVSLVVGTFVVSLWFPLINLQNLAQ